jgi:transposase-like protein
MLLGTDVESLDIPHLILAEHEDAENWFFFFVVLKNVVGYPLRGAVSDGDPVIAEALERVYPGVPHQLCVKHFLDGLHRYFRYESSHGRGTWREIERFEKAARRCLYADTLEQAQRVLAAIQIDPGFQKAGLQDGMAMIERHWPHLTQHFRMPELPRTSNVVEGTIRKLDRRLDAMDSFGNHQNAWNILKMLTVYNRFRQLTDCREPHAHRNGFAPLELAGVNIHGVNWIKFSQKRDTPASL